MFVCVEGISSVRLLLQVEDKFVCSESGAARYVNRGDLYLPLPVPLMEATNTPQVEQFKARKQAAEKKGDRL